MDHRVEGLRAGGCKHLSERASSRAFAGFGFKRGRGGDQLVEPDLLRVLRGREFLARCALDRAVFAVMLFLYSSRIIKVTDRFRRIVIGATVGIMVFYLVSLVVNLVGGSVPFLQSTSLFGIGFSFLVAGSRRCAQTQ